MHVVATAGHVDHGKSTLVRALTGTDPDRLAEERRRGLSIALGYAWTTLPGAQQPIAFVDVPGHERFVSTMLAGVGPVPAALLVLAADDPWMPQAEEHLRALDALGVRHAVVAITRSDRADPAPMIAEARSRLAGTGLAAAPVLSVSSLTGAGISALQAALGALTSALPSPDPAAAVRLWVDRRFSMAGAGTVVTGTLPAGRIRAGDRLQIGAAGSTSVRVRSLQSLGEDVVSVTGTARVALRLGTQPAGKLDRGVALVTPGAWWPTTVFDVCLQGPGRPPRAPMLHIGASATLCRLRLLGNAHARITLKAPLPMHVGDRVLVRDPGTRVLWGAEVLDPAPSPFIRRGEATARGHALEHVRPGSLVDQVRRRGPVPAAQLSRMGVPLPAAQVAKLSWVDDWLLTPEQLDQISRQVQQLVTEHRRRHPLETGPSVASAVQELKLPDVRLLEAAVRPPLSLRDGRLVLIDASGRMGDLPAAVQRAVDELAADLAEAPFAAPDAGRLNALGLDHRSLAAAHRAGRLLRLADQVVLLPGADQLAVDVLARLEQPFSASEARQALGTSRRVVLPLLERLDRQGHTLRLPDNRRRIRGPQ